MAPTRVERSLAIDLLRGIAVTMVMAAHLPFSFSNLTSGGVDRVYPSAGISSVLAHGHYGVQLFLVISGYCIHTRWARRGDPNARIDFVAFWRRRLTRLYPPYVFVLLGSVAFTVSAARLFPGSVPPLSAKQLAIDVVVLLLLLQNLTNASARVGNPPFWSLALEEQLYLLYFPLLAMRRKGGWWLAASIALGITLGWLALGTLVPSSWQHGWFCAGPAYWFAWTLGAIAAEAHLGLVRLPRVCRSAMTFAVVALVGSFAAEPVRHLIVTVSFFFLLMFTIGLETRGSLRRARWLSPFIQLGSISYGVYLVHNIIFIVAKRLLVNFDLPPFAILVLRAMAGLGAGYLVYLFVERPFLRLSQRISVPIRRAGGAV
jgi:peptidoglycan/LPS O-acetylase OafA/YrhL